MVMDDLTPSVRPGADNTEQCALKLWQLQPLFMQLARSWSLTSEISQCWPGLALCKQRLIVMRRLELRLQTDYLRDGREFYELRFLETGPGFIGIRVRHDFGCGRLLADEVLSEEKVLRYLEERVRLLGLVRKAVLEKRGPTTRRQLRESRRLRGRRDAGQPKTPTFQHQSADKIAQ